MAFEQTKEIVAAIKEKMIEAEQALDNFKKTSPETRFSGYTFDNVIGHGKALQEAVTIAKKIAPQNSSVLLVGETGTGKEIFAQSIHKSSKRSQKKFVALNCAAIPDSLIESMLFGTQKGSFTGSENRPGFFEEAQGGTLFLDEIENVKEITKELFDKVISMYPKAGIIYSTVRSFKEIMFSKKENKLDSWIVETKKLNIQEFNSFINGIERDIEAVKNGIKYEYNNGLAEGSVNKIKVIKRIMYGRCSFALLKQKVLLQY